MKSSFSVRESWWKLLSDHLHQSTQQRLRGLQIYRDRGWVTIRATVPTDALRQQAESAARQIVPGELLRFSIRVASTGLPPAPPNDCRAKTLERLETALDARRRFDRLLG